MYSPEEYENRMKAWRITEKCNVLEMTYDAFIHDVYYPGVTPSVRPNTLSHKKQRLKDHVIPAFGKMLMKDITPQHILCWQEMEREDYDKRTGKPYSETYLWSNWKELKASLNYAVRYCNLPDNPCNHVPALGSQYSNKTPVIWTIEQYKQFRAAIDNRIYYLPFDILFWGGLRLGEMLALYKSDVDLSHGTLSVTKSYTLVDGEGIISLPKTEAGIRKVRIPDFVCDEFKEYFIANNDLAWDERLFSAMSCERMGRALHRYADVAEIPDTKIHNLRHSHISMLVSFGYSLLEVGKRVGHNSIQITNHYTHAYESTQEEMVQKLNEAYNEK